MRPLLPSAVMGRGAAAILSIAVLTGATHVEAKPGKVALVALEISGDGAPELRTQLASSVVAGLVKAGVDAVELPDVLESLANAPELIGCISSTCLARIGDRIGADGFVRGRVFAEGANYTVALELYNRTELVNKLELPCTVCTINELNKLTSETASRLVADASDNPVQVVIRSEPSGADLTIDGLKRGAAPFEGPLPPGPHFVVAELSGVGTVRQRIEVTTDGAGEPIVLRIAPRLEASPDEPVDHDERRFGAWKWVTAGVAAAGIATGIALVALDGRPTCNGDGRVCRDLRDTALSGWITLGVGVAAGVATGWMFYRDSQTDRSATLSVVPNARGAAAMVDIRF